jgi:hypothetical protein
MERGEATRGRIAAALSGSDSIEIKATIPQTQVRVLLKRFKLNVDPEPRRFIYFFLTRPADDDRTLGTGRRCDADGSTRSRRRSRRPPS